MQAAYTHTISKRNTSIIKVKGGFVMPKKMMALALLMVCFLAFSPVNAEQTVGLFIYDSTATWDGLRGYARCAAPRYHHIFDR